MIRAVLFDMDGVLFDTEVLGFQAMSRIAQSLGYAIDLPFYQSTLGVPNTEAEPFYRAKLGTAFPYETAMQRFRAFFAEYNRKQGLPHKPGLLPCLTGLKARGLRLALATSTLRPLVAAYFQAMPDVAACFDATVCGGEVPNGKPAPDIYIAAANAVGCTPGDCLGVEDSLNGVRSIRAAGAGCVLIPDLLPYDERFAPCVDYRLQSLMEVCPLVDQLNGTAPQA